MVGMFRKKEVESPIPVCPDHHVEMRLRGKLGRPTRFADQREAEYTLIYFCPIDGCNQTATRERTRAQIPVAGEAPARPFFSRTTDRTGLS
jgi:hypothetical protein